MGLGEAKFSVQWSVVKQKVGGVLAWSLFWLVGWLGFWFCFGFFYIDIFYLLVWFLNSVPDERVA